MGSFVTIILHSFNYLVTRKKETYLGEVINIKTSTILLVIIGLLLVGGVYYFVSGSMSQPTNSGLSTNPTPTSSIGGGPGGNITGTAEVKSFTVEGKPFEYSPSEIKVKQGETVQITFKNLAGFHDLTIDGLNVATKQISAGETDTVQFIADKAGTFEYFCSVGTHREQGMVGKLIVE